MWYHTWPDGVPEYYLVWQRLWWGVANPTTVCDTGDLRGHFQNMSQRQISDVRVFGSVKTGSPDGTVRAQRPNNTFSSGFNKFISEPTPVQGCVRTVPSFLRSGYCGWSSLLWVGPWSRWYTWSPPGQKVRASLSLSRLQDKQTAVIFPST